MKISELIDRLSHFDKDEEVTFSVKLANESKIQTNEATIRDLHGLPQVVIDIPSTQLANALNQFAVSLLDSPIVIKALKKRAEYIMNEVSGDEWKNNGLYDEEEKD